METIKILLETIIKWGMLFFEIAGVAILLYTGVKAVVELFQKNEFMRLHLAQGISLALQFKIGGEVLHTVIAASWEELAMLGATILMRGVLTFLIHWEIKHMEPE